MISRNQKKMEQGGNPFSIFPSFEPQVWEHSMVSPILAEFKQKSNPGHGEAYQRSDGLSDVGAMPEDLGTPRIIGYGIDTLMFTAGGNVLPSEWLVSQKEIWNDYQSQYERGDDFSTLELPNGEWWKLYPYGSKCYAYQISNPEVGYIKIWNTEKWSSGINSKQHLHIHLYSKKIHQLGDGLIDYIKELVNQFFDSIEGVELRVSRLDLYSDVSRKNFLTEEEVANTITRSKVRRSHYGDEDKVSFDKDEEELLKAFLSTPPSYNKGGVKLTKELQDKLIRSYNNKSVSGADVIIRKRELETAYFGKVSSDVMCRMYNKTKQVKSCFDTDTPLRWNANGFDYKNQVIRVEFQMNRSFLKELDDGKYVRLEDCVSNKGFIWGFLTQNWLRMVDEVKVNNSKTSVVSSFWQLIQKSFNGGVNVIVRKSDFKGKINQLWLQGVGCISQMISYGMNDNEDDYMLRSTIKALEDTLTRQKDRGEYYERRKLLGLA